MKKTILFDLYDTVLKDISFDFKAGIKWLYNTYFTQACSWEELKTYEETLLDEVRNTLEDLQKQGIPMYILSNSIFTGKATERLLEDFGILQYFTKVYASADYGVRKPGEKFFGIAIEEILEKHPGMEKNDILYVGNDYVTDVQGANAAGRDVAWYNVKGLPDEKGICTCNLTKFNEILNVI